MQEHPHQQIYDLALALARTVGERIRDEVVHERTVELHFKGPRDIVTEVDIWSENLIRASVAEEFPEHLVIGEESMALRGESGYGELRKALKDSICWIVDPIDGTVNFAHRLPHSCVSIGVIDRGEPVVGVVYDPLRDEMFHAVKGGGAFCNKKSLRVGNCNSLEQCLVATGMLRDYGQMGATVRQSFERLFCEAQSVRCQGAAAIDLCWVALGRLDGFVELHLKPWDVAAAQIILAEAGGVLDNLWPDNGVPCLLGDAFVAGNMQVVAELRRVFPKP